MVDGLLTFRGTQQEHHTIAFSRTLCDEISRGSHCDGEGIYARRWTTSDTLSVNVHCEEVKPARVPRLVLNVSFSQGCKNLGTHQTSLIRMVDKLFEGIVFISLLGEQSLKAFEATTNCLASSTHRRIRGRPCQEPRKLFHMEYLIR